MTSPSGDKDRAKEEEVEDGYYRDRNVVDSLVASKVDKRHPQLNETTGDQVEEGFDSPSGVNEMKADDTAVMISLQKVDPLKKRMEVGIRFANGEKEKNLDIYYTKSVSGKIDVIMIPPLHRSLRKTRGKLKRNYALGSPFLGLDLIFSYSGMMERPHATHMSQDTGLETSVKFSNQCDYSRTSMEMREKNIVQVFWVNYKGDAILRKELKEGESYIEHTFSGHVWVVHECHSGRSMLMNLGRNSVESSQRFSIGEIIHDKHMHVLNLLTHYIYNNPSMESDLCFLSRSFHHVSRDE
jgi:hypothetical protein